MEVFFYITIMVGLSVVLLIALFLYQAYLKKLEHETARKKLEVERERISLEKETLAHNKAEKGQTLQAQSAIDHS